jgi:hypothetical protein
MVKTFTSEQADKIELARIKCAMAAGEHTDGDLQFVVEQLDTALLKLQGALKLLEKISTAVNDPLLNQRQRISIATDIRAYLEPPK